MGKKETLEKKIGSYLEKGKVATFENDKEAGIMVLR
jgi:hypothetical protein